LLVCSSRFSISRFLIHHRVSIFSIERFRHALVARIQGLRSKSTLMWHCCHTPNDIHRPGIGSARRPDPCRPRPLVAYAGVAVAGRLKAFHKFGKGFCLRWPRAGPRPSARCNTGVRSAEAGRRYLADNRHKMNVPGRSKATLSVRLSAISESPSPPVTSLPLRQLRQLGGRAHRRRSFPPIRKGL
jgi:hypothetical protein